MDIEDEMAICDHYCTVSVEGHCSSKCEVGCIVMNTDTRVKYNVAPHDIMKEVVLVSLEEKFTFVKFLHLHF